MQIYTSFSFHFYFSLSLLFDLANGQHKRNKVSFVFPLVTTPNHNFFSADRRRFIFAYFQASN